MRTAIRLTLAIFLVLAIFFLLLLKPYKKYDLVRNKNTDTLIVEYQNYTGDPICTKLYLVDNGTTSAIGILPHLPNDLIDPHSTDLSEGDKIELYGFRYAWEEKNLITGKVVKKRSGRFDLISWKKISGESNNRLHTTLKKNIDKISFENKNYTDCKK